MRFSLIKSTSQSKELFQSSSEGDLEQTMILLGNPRIKINYQDHLGRSPFYRACFHGHLFVVRLFLKNPRTKVNLRQNQGATPFLAACQEGHVAVVKELLSHPSIDVNLPKEQQASPFFMACQGNHVAVVQLLLNQPHVAIHVANSMGASPFFISCEEGNYQVVELLLQDPRILEKELNHPREDGITPFWLAVHKNDVILAEMLLAASAKVDLEATWAVDQTKALEVAAMWGYQKLAELIMRYRKEPKKVSYELAQKRGFHYHRAARVFSLITLFSDKYLTFKKTFPSETLEEKEKRQRAQRYISISQRLPAELQMMLSNRTFGISSSFVSRGRIDQAVQSLFCLYSSESG